MTRLPSLLLAAALLAACGAAPAGPAGPTSVRATTGNLALEATPATARGGQTVNVTLMVTGPADYQGGCVQTMHIWVMGSASNQVWEQPVPAVMCMAIADIHLAAGETANFGAHWPVASGLAPGTYSIHGLFLYTLRPGAGTRVRENLPVVSIQVSA